MSITPAVLLDNEVIKREIVTNILDADYTLTPADDGLWLRTLSDDPVTITVPPQSEADFPAYMRLTIEQAGLGLVTFDAGAGVTLNSAFGLAIGAQFVVVTLKRVDVDEWTLAFLEMVEAAPSEAEGFALSDEESDLTTGVKLTYYMVAALVLTDFKAAVNVASSSGPVVVEVTVGGVLRATVTIAQGENVGGAPVIDGTSFPLNGRVEFNITAAGTGAVGLKASLIGYAP